VSSSAHALLSRIAEHKRDAEADILQQLTGYKQTLADIITQSLHDVQALQAQHGLKLTQGSTALDLMMIDQSIQEHRQRVLEVRFEMGELDKAIAQQRAKWSQHHKKHVAHQKMDGIATTKQQRAADNKQQMMMDNQFSATMVAKKRQGET